MSETVSVIVPCYKVEAYLHRCVDSILRQTHHDLDVILVDDGSPDRCGEICDEYATADTRVRVLHQPNQGLSAARNAGLEVMTGKYVTFVDGDDWLDDTCIGNLHRIMIDTDADLSVCNLLRTSDERVTWPAAAGTILEMSRDEAIAQILKPRYGSMVAACGKLYRAELFTKIRFPVGRLHEDAFTTYRVILQCRKVALTTSPLYVYWQRPDSIMGSPFNPKAKLDIIDALTERSRVLRRAGMESAASISSGQVLSTYLELVQHSASCRDNPGTNTLDLRSLAQRLRREPQPLKFRAFYTLVMAAPWLARRAHAILAGQRKG